MAKKTASKPTHGEVVGKLVADDEFRADWERLAFARAVAAKVVGHRADHGLTQKELAGLLGITQPQVARLENAEVDPSRATLERLAGKLGMEFTISIVSKEKVPKQLTRGAREGAVVASYKAHDSTVRFAASA